MSAPSHALHIRDLCVAFGTHPVLDHLDLDVYEGEVIGFVGGSGTGKSVLMRSILGLTPKRSGVIEVFGQNLDLLDRDERRKVERSWGVLFQHGALFSGLTVLQNIQLAMREHTAMSARLMDELALCKIELVGLPSDAAHKYPSQLSGGMIKRAALARALALDPRLLFLDEPTAGLDPIGASEFDALVRTLQKTLGLTVFMVTHDLDSLYAICDRIAALAERRVVLTGTVDDMMASTHPWVYSYFHGKRARQLVSGSSEA
jgi:phospholipid/cholesterol/gamma-HCH transport system ATP-binding protein